MNIAVICFTEHGAVLAERLSKEFSEREMTCRAWIKKKETQIPDCRNVQVLTQSLREWTKEQFAAVDAMIFIGATEPLISNPSKTSAPVQMSAMLLSVEERPIPSLHTSFAIRNAAHAFDQPA